MSDEETRDHSVRRVTSKDRKDRLEYGQNLFPPESPLPPDPQSIEAQAASEPLPFDAAVTYPAQEAERFPPLPFDGEDPQAFSAQEAERFPPLPTPGWARANVQSDEPIEDTPPEPEPVAPRTPARGKKRPPAPRKQQKKSRGCLYNLLTVVFLLLTIGALAFGIYLFQNPYSSLNPLPPPTSIPIFITTTPRPPTDVPPPSETPIPLDLTLLTEEPETTGDIEVQATATYTPLPPEVLTEMAPDIPTPEEFTGEQAAT